MPIPKAVAGFNKHVTNRLILLFAGWVPPFAVVSHVGRTSSRLYRTPVLTFKTETGYVFALTYGRRVDWVRNLLASGSGVLEYGGESVDIHSFSVAAYEDVRHRFPWLVRRVLQLISVTDCLLAEAG
ncbi:nitroreductase family deazaflavin-dependent oxidoreductase [Candidatus Bathyarchaeota archaeon]|nr:nitroreductase family deazaflavin-dependent oxidoreductase [Candidatus Bathyarchaeota archaeon]